jgi:hypothetical protein
LTELPSSTRSKPAAFLDARQRFLARRARGRSPAAVRRDGVVGGGGLRVRHALAPQLDTFWYVAAMDIATLEILSRDADEFAPDGNRHDDDNDDIERELGLR